MTREELTQSWNKWSGDPVDFILADRRRCLERVKDVLVKVNKSAAEMANDESKSVNLRSINCALEFQNAINMSLSIIDKELGE